MNVRSIGIYHLLRTRRLRETPAARRHNETHARSTGGLSPLATYLICTNPRSGSWLLSGGLASTSLAGTPREWFNPLVEQQKRAQWRINNASDANYRIYLDYVRARSTTRNGISGIKLHYYQFAELPKKLAAIEGLRGMTPANMLATTFPNIRYVWLTRRDKARQAISYQLACITGQWWLIEGIERNKREARPEEPVFDFDAIARLEQTLMDNDLKWQLYFQTNNIVPLTVYYEDLVSDYRDNIVRMLRWLGIPNADVVPIPPSRLKQQSNARNEEWLARYMAFKAERGHLERSSESAEPLLERSRRPFDLIPDIWKEWITRTKRLKTSDEAIIEVLVSNGYGRESAIAEVKKTGSRTDPATD